MHNRQRCAPHSGIGRTLEEGALGEGNAKLANTLKRHPWGATNRYYMMPFTLSIAQQGVKRGNAAGQMNLNRSRRNQLVYT